MSAKRGFQLNALLGVSAILACLFSADPVIAQASRSEGGVVGADGVYAQTWLNRCTQTCASSHPLTHPVERARIYVVPDSMREEAIVQLQMQPAVLLDDNELTHYLDSQTLSGDEILEKAIADPSVETRREPGDLAASFDVAYLKTLRGRLRPYLVRAVVANKGNYTFRVAWYGNALGISSGSLGVISYYRKPLIVFLEAMPENVWINAIATK